MDKSFLDEYKLAGRDSQVLEFGCGAGMNVIRDAARRFLFEFRDDYVTPLLPAQH